MAQPYPLYLVASRPMRIDPIRDPFVDLTREVHRMVDHFFPLASQMMGVTPPLSMDALPRIDVQEDEDALCITAELPGVEAGDIELRVEGDALLICGEKRTQNEASQSQYRVMERTFGQFRRTVPLPFLPDPTRIDAEYGQGVLTVRIPKQARIEVNQRIGVRPQPSRANALSEVSNAVRQDRLPAAEDLALGPDGDGR